MTTAMVFTHRRTGEAASVFLRAWRTVGAGLGGGAIRFLKRKTWNVKILAKHVPINQPVKSGVMKPKLSGVFFYAGRERLVWRPCDDSC
jgi:hypothetical protein